MPKKILTPEPEEPTYDVESINQARVTSRKQWEYNIKWGGYSESENSWEPESHLTGCRRMMRDFWEQVGVEYKAKAKSLSIGRTLAPSSRWIQKEREAYQRSAAKKKSKRIESEDEASSSGVSVGTKPFSPHTFDDDSDEDDVPLSQKVASSIHLRLPKASVTTSDVVDKNASSSKRKLDDVSVDRPWSSSEPPSKRSKPDDTPSSSKAQERTWRKPSNSKESNKGHDFSSLFGDESDGDSNKAPLASTSLATALTLSAPQSSGSQVNRSTVKPILSVDTSRPKESSLPAHRQRQMNPRIKSMPSPVTDTTSLGGISTKARIILSGNTTGQRLAGLSGPKSILPATGTILSNSPIGIDPSTSSQPRVPSQELDVDNWLKENISSKEGLARRVAEDGWPLSAEPSVSNSSAAAQQGLHFSKRWRWTGQLYVGDNEPDDGFAELIGSVVLTDSTLLDPNTRHIGIQLLLPSGVDSLSLRYQYSLAAFHTVLAGFNISQFARMTAEPSEDEDTFNALVEYMTKHETFTQSPLLIDDREVATIFVFPASLEYLWDRIAVPPRLRQIHGLLIAIGFQAYTPATKGEGGLVETYQSDWKTSPRLDTTRETGGHELSRAILTLDFPENLFKRVSQKECVIFTTPNDRELVGRESMALDTILRNAPGCKVVSMNTGSARFIFIHLSAWDILHKLPGLIDRRLRRPDIQFFTYGSDPAVERKRWGVREVFPIGGIVTFTPRAIAEDPDGVEKLIAQLDEHPLWACYLLPSVVAMVIEVSNSDSGPNSKLKDAIGALCGILMPLEKGQIALTWHPPSTMASKRDSDNGFSPEWLDWLEDQAQLSKLRGNELVQECQRRFHKRQERSEKDVEAGMVRDLLAMQSELREVYRRFVIITDTTGPCNTSREEAATKSTSTADTKDAFELTHVNDFTFGDDYPFVDERN